MTDHAPTHGRPALQPRRPRRSRVGRAVSRQPVLGSRDHRAAVRRGAAAGARPRHREAARPVGAAQLRAHRRRLAAAADHQPAGRGARGAAQRRRRAATALPRLRRDALLASVVRGRARGHRRRRHPAHRHADALSALLEGDDRIVAARVRCARWPSRPGSAIGFEVTHIDRYAADPRYLDAMADTVTEAWDAIPVGAARRDRAALQRARAAAEVHRRGRSLRRATSRRPAAASSSGCSLPRRRVLAYQSRTGPVKWIGPGTEEMLEHLGARGRHATCSSSRCRSCRITSRRSTKSICCSPSRARRPGITGYWRTER